MRFKKIAIAFLLVAINAVGFVGFIPTKAEEESQMASIFTAAQAEETPGLVSILTTAAVRVDQETVDELFNFTTDLRNDHLYWGDAVAGTTLIKEGKHGIPSAGTQYEQQGEWVGYPFHNIIDVTQAKRTGNMRYIEFESHSVIVDGLEYHAVYQIEDTKDGPVFIVTAVSTSFGITEEQMIGWHYFALSNYLAYWGSTGEILWDYSKTVDAPTIDTKLTNHDKIIREYML